MKILIDNGHGSNTAGKRSPDGRLLEYAYTREIAERVVHSLPRLRVQSDSMRMVKSPRLLGTYGYTSVFELEYGRYCTPITRIVPRVSLRPSLLSTI